MHRYGFAPALLTLSGLLLASAPGAAADIDKNKLIGTWTQQLPSPEDSGRMQFTSDGKFFLSATHGGKTKKFSGIYMVTGDKLKWMGKDSDGNKHIGISSIIKLTDKKLVISQKMGAVTMEYNKQ